MTYSITKKFDDLRIVDNFYQTSSFFPMPVVAISTLDENDETNLGSYSLCFPYYIAGKQHYTMLLETRNSSNTARNILRTRKCALNFMPDDPKYMEEMVRLGYPGLETAKKMKDCTWKLIPGLRQQNDPDSKYPLVVEEAFQIMECTWMAELDGAEKDTVQEEYAPPYHDFNGITSEFGAHFILKIDKMLLKPKYAKAIIDGVEASKFPDVPIDYGYRDNTHFWFSEFKKPYKKKIADNNNTSLSTVTYAADRVDPDVKFTEEACEQLIKVPRIFLKTALKGCVDWAKKNEVTLITKEHMASIRDKRAEEKKK